MRGRGNSRGIGGDASDLVFYQQFLGLFVEPARMPRFAGNRRGGRGAKRLEELRRDRRIELQAGWKLHQQAADFLAQRR